MQGFCSLLLIRGKALFALCEGKATCLNMLNSNMFTFVETQLVNVNYTIYHMFDRFHTVENLVQGKLSTPRESFSILLVLQQVVQKKRLFKTRWAFYIIT